MRAGLAALVFPGVDGCPLCGAPSERDGVCGPCLADLSKPPPAWCARCGRPDTSTLCRACRLAPAGPVLPVAAIGLFEGPLREAVHRLKFDRLRRLAPPLGRILAERVLRQLPSPDAVVPIPLHRIRLAERGFNQSQLVGRAIAESLGCQLRSDALARRRYGRPQSRLDRRARLENVRHAFIARATDLAEQRVLLVDDVLTTGATVAEAAAALRSVGARPVGVAVLAVEGS